MGPHPQQLVEHALATSRADQCVVVVEDSTSANLRWANNTLTTNGVMRSVEVTVISFVGEGNASVSGTAASPEQVGALVERADAAARVASAAEDRAELVTGEADTDWDEAPGETSIHVFDDFAARLGEAFDRAEAEQRIFYGFVFHEVTTTYLGTSAGLRKRHVQPTGHYGCTGKDAALTASAWVGGATRDFSDVDAGAVTDELVDRLGWSGRRVDLPAGRYDTVLPPTAMADLLVATYWSCGARDAADGQSAFSAPGGRTRLGESVARPGVRLWSDPSAPGLQCQPFVTAGHSSGESSV